MQRLPAVGARELAPAIASASIQSALTSTGLPMRGVTGTPSIRASIHVSAQPSSPCRSRPSRVDADAEARALEVPVDDLLERRRELGAEVVVARHGDVTAERVDEPERAVRGVVLERAGVGGVREHPLGDASPPHGGAPRAPPRTRPVERKSPSYDVIRSRDHSPNHGIAGDRRRAVVVDHELVGREHELRVSASPDAAPAGERARPLRAARTIAAAAGSAPPNGAAAAVTSCASPTPSSTEKAPGAHMSSTSLSPRAASSRARTPRYQAPPGCHPAPATR